MSAEILRTAATEIRADWGGTPPAGQESVHRYHLAVADWLVRAAAFWEHPELARQGRPNDLHHAREVARAYLGGE